MLLFHRLLTYCLVLGLGLAGCGSDDSGGSVDTMGSTDDTSAASGGVSSSTGGSSSTSTETTGASDTTAGVQTGSTTTSSSDAAGGTSGTTGDTMTSDASTTSSGGSGTTGNPNDPPFNSTLLCGENNGLEWSRLQGTLGEQDYLAEDSDPSNIQRGRLENSFGVLILEWEGSLEMGLVVPLTGGLIIVGDGHSLARERVCVTEGIFGAVPEAQQPPEAVLFRYQITGARLGEDCTGEEVQIDLDGCWYRDNTLLP